MLWGSQERPGETQVDVCVEDRVSRSSAGSNLPALGGSRLGRRSLSLWVNSLSSQQCGIETKLPCSALSHLQICEQDKRPLLICRPLKSGVVCFTELLGWPASSFGFL